MSWVEIQKTYMINSYTLLLLFFSASLLVNLETCDSGVLGYYTIVQLPLLRCDMNLTLINFCLGPLFHMWTLHQTPTNRLANKHGQSVVDLTASVMSSLWTWLTPPPFQSFWKRGQARYIDFAWWWLSRFLNMTCNRQTGCKALVSKSQAVLDFARSAAAAAGRSVAAAQVIITGTCLFTPCL